MKPSLKDYKSATRPNLKYRVRWQQDGKRKNRFFEKRDLARSFYEAKKREWDALGNASSRMNDDQRTESLEAFKKLQPYNLSMLDCASYITRIIEAGSKLDGFNLRKCIDDTVERIDVQCKIKATTCADAVDRFLDFKRSRNLRPQTISTFETSMNGFFRDKLERQLSSVTSDECEAWISAPAGIRTQNNRRIHLRMFFKWASLKNQGFVVENPVESGLITVEKGEPVVLSVAQCRRLMSAAASVDNGEALVYHVLALFCAIRPWRELRRLSWDDISLEKKAVQLGSGVAKKRSRRMVEIPENALVWLERAKLKQKPVCPQDFLNTLKRVRIEAGIDPWPHDAMRHTGITARLLIVGDENAVAGWAGNSPQEIHESYRSIHYDKSDAEAFYSIVPEENTVVEFESEATA